MSFSTIIVVLIILLILYYTGMILWEIYQDSMKERESTEIEEEEIDISSDFDGIDQQPTLIEVESGDHKNQEKKKRPQFPFPWTTEQIREAFEKIEMEEKCPELDNVVFYNETKFKTAV